jgi:hypothetical protein
MNTHRLFNILIAIALLAVAALTISQSLATARVVQAASAEQNHSADASYCISASQRVSLRSSYVPEAGGWYPRIGNRLTGVEGGLLALLSEQLRCSR